MNLLVALFPTGMLQGLILCFVALGVMIPFRFLNFPDLSSEGSYPFGGILCAVLILAGIHPLLATSAAMVGAGVLGLGTAFLHLRYRVNTLLAGIILSTMVYSINLRLMGKPNLSLFQEKTFFSLITNEIGLKILLVLGLVLCLALPILYFLYTEKGLRFRAVGLNPRFAARQGVHLTLYTFFGLFLGNALCGLAGGLMVQNQNYVDIGMGVGIVIHALAAVMIGETLLGTQTLKRQVAAPLLGALVYQQIQGVALALGLAPSDLKLLTGAIVVAVIVFKNKKSLV